MAMVCGNEVENEIAIMCCREDRRLGFDEPGRARFSNRRQQLKADFEAFLDGLSCLDAFEVYSHLHKPAVQKKSGQWMNSPACTPAEVLPLVEVVLESVRDARCVLARAIAGHRARPEATVSRFFGPDHRLRRLGEEAS